MFPTRSSVCDPVLPRWAGGASVGEGERAQSYETICNVYSSWNLEPVVLTGLASKKKEGRRRRAIRAKKRRRKRPVGIVWGAAAGERRGGRRGTSLSRLPESAYSSGGRIEAWRTLGRRETRLLVDCHHVPAVAPHKHGSGDALQQDLKILHVQVRGVAPARWRR